MMGKDVLEELCADARPADRGCDQYRRVQGYPHFRSSTRKTSSSVCRPCACARRTSLSRNRRNSETERKRRSASRARSLFEIPAATLCRSSARSSSSETRSVIVATYYIVLQIKLACKWDR